MGADAFGWDAEKSVANGRKHHVTFDEATTAFDDPNRRREYDSGHSALEERWLLLGVSDRSRLLTVIYTKRNETIRIISARRANQAETRRYIAEA